MEDKYNLTKEQNIFLAKKTIVENIYNAIKLEGCNSTYMQTEKILHGLNDGDVPLNEIQVILNLKRAWQDMMKNIDKEIDIDFICRTNSYVSQNESLDWGVLRYGKVGVRLMDDSTYEAPIPNENDVMKKLKDINEIKSPTERAIDYYIWGIKSQLFWDGNKRTSNIIANAYLIKEGKGIITVHEKDIKEFNENLTEYYKTDNPQKLKQFLYNKCVVGLDIDKDIEKKHKISWEKAVKKARESDKDNGNEF